MLHRLILVMGLLVGACTADPAPDRSPEPSGPVACGAGLSPGPAPLRRLTRTEYDNTVFQLLGDNSRPARGFPPDEEAGGFDNQAAALSVSPVLAEGYLEAAEALATTWVERQLPGLRGCTAPVDAAGCAEAAAGALDRLGPRAWRRPLEPTERARLLGLFDQGARLDGGFDPRAGLEVMVGVLLQSPHFLYRVEFGDAAAAEDNVAPLTSHEIASRLSFLLWESMPDDALLERAAADDLRTPEAIEEEAQRLLAAPRAREAVRHFHRQWLDLDSIPEVASAGKDPTIYPDFDPAILPLLQEEAEAFVEHVVFDGEGTIEALLTAPYSMMNATVAAFYGLPGPTGDAFEPVELDPGRYAGVLTQAGWLMSHAKPDRSSPIHRGLFVRTQLLCQIPPPPPDVVPEAPLVDDTKTTREQFDQHKADPLCAGCHQYIDPLGFGLENFDGMGRYRSDEWGIPVDARGEVIGANDADGPFDGAAQLATTLADSQQVRDCVTRQWFRYGHGRAETGADDCTLALLTETVEETGGDIQALLLTMTRTPAFRFRRVVVPGGGQ